MEPPGVSGGGGGDGRERFQVVENFSRTVGVEVEIYILGTVVV